MPSQWGTDQPPKGKGMAAVPKTSADRRPRVSGASNPRAALLYPSRLKRGAYLSSGSVYIIIYVQAVSSRQTTWGCDHVYSPDTTKYLIHLTLQAEGVVEKPDVVGAIFGQTEGLLGEDLDLRDLQRTGRVGRIDVQITSKKGETRGDIYISSSLDRAETAILAASLETIDRVGPCVARVAVESIEDIRVTKRRRIVERAKELLLDHFDEGAIDSYILLDEVREAIRIEKIEAIGEDKVPGGPNVVDSDAIIIVEGRADVINLLKYGIKNAVAVEGTNVPETIVDLSDKKTATAFLDGDRGGELILRELLQIADIDFVAFSPRGKSVEDMSRKGDHQGPPKQDPRRRRPRTALCRGWRTPPDRKGPAREQQPGADCRAGTVARARAEGTFLAPRPPGAGLRPHGGPVPLGRLLGPLRSAVRRDREHARKYKRPDRRRRCGHGRRPAPARPPRRPGRRVCCGTRLLRGDQAAARSG